MRIDVNRVPGLPQNGYAGGKPSMIILHETANQTSTLQNERDYVGNHWGDAFFHYLVDSERAMEVANPDFLAWGAGPQANPYAIHIELVRDNGRNFNQAYANYIELARTLASRYGIPLVFNRQQNGVVTHHWVSDNMGGTDHTDPDSWLSSNGVSLDKLKKDIEGQNMAEKMDLNTLRILAAAAWKWDGRDGRPAAHAGQKDALLTQNWGQVDLTNDNLRKFAFTSDEAANGFVIDNAVYAERDKLRTQVAAIGTGPGSDYAKLQAIKTIVES